MYDTFINMYESTKVHVQYVVQYVLSYFRTNESIMKVLSYICSVQLYMYVTRVQYESTKVLSKVFSYTLQYCSPL